MGLGPVSSLHNSGRFAPISPSNTALHVGAVAEPQRNSSFATTDLQISAAASVLPRTANKVTRAPEHGAPSPPQRNRFHSCHPHTQPSPHYLLNESQERFPVVLPLLWKLRSRWIFAAGQLQCDLKAVGPHVVVILHPTWEKEAEMSQEQCTHIPTTGCCISLSFSPTWHLPRMLPQLQRE